MINTLIYGTPEQWFDYQTTIFDDESMKFKQAYIGNGGKRLQDGYGYGIDLNKPIDKSLSWCALGNFSTWSRIEYYKTHENMTKIAADSRSATNFSLNVTNGSSNGIYITEKNNKYGSLQRWSPKAINSYATYNANFNANVEPLTQIPLRNCVMVPQFRVATRINSANNTTGMDIKNVLAWDYYGTTATGNHTTHPYILSITMIPYHYERQTSSTRTSTGTWKSSSILDEIALQKGIPLDMEKPNENIMGNIYAYNIFTPPSTSAGYMLFGFTRNNTSVAGVSVSDIIGFTSAATGYGSGTAGLYNISAFIVYPHQYQVFSEPFTVSSSSGGVINKGSFLYLEYYDNGPDDNLQEWVRKQIACFGLFFTDDKDTAETGEFNDPLMCLGILDENNVGQGFYSTGEDNENQKQWNWETTNDSDYDPSDIGGGGEPYGDSTRFIKAGDGINPGGKWYADNNLATWNGLLSWCNAIPLEGDDKVDKSLFFGQNPIDCIIEAKYIFVNDYTFGKTMAGTNDPIVLGSYSTGGVNSHPFTKSYPAEFDCGFVDIDRPWGDFRDYEPYTTITLILPFAESITLPTDIFMGHRCNLTEVIDPLTGDLIYYVFVDYILYTSLTGNCAMDLSINGLETATYAQTRFSLQAQSDLSYINAIASLIGGASGASIASAMHNPKGAIIQGLGGLANFAAGVYQGGVLQQQRSRTAPPPAKIQKASSNVQWGSMPYPHIVVASPLMVDGYSDADYKTQTGFATYKVGKIGDEKGYVVCSSVNPSGLSCSKEEADMITRALTQGIYIK